MTSTRAGVAPRSRKRSPRRRGPAPGAPCSSSRWTAAPSARAPSRIRCARPGSSRTRADSFVVPEGDTIWKTAQALRVALAGRVVTGFRTSSPDISPAAERAIRGRTVSGVEARGKHLLMSFSCDGEDVVLHTHMRMNGEWHIYAVGERWRRSAARARVVVETDAYVAPCFDAPVIELLRARDVARHPALAALGPDAMTEAFDIEAA